MTGFSPTVAPLATASAETIDVADVARTVRRQWRIVLLATLIGLAAAVGVLLFAPRRFTASASLLLRSAQDPSGSILSRVGLPTELAPSSLGNALKSPLETELQLLASRDVLGAVVDSLGLQARLLGRDGLPSRAVLVPAAYPGSFRRRTFAFERQADGTYRVTGDGASVVAAPGTPFRLPVVGTVTITPGAPLARFRVKFEDREDAITRAVESLGIDKKGGEVAGLDFAGPDSLTAAAVPNAIVATYLDRRRTVDRGVNERRYEFLRAQADSVATQLAGAEDALRRLQERSGVLDPEVSGKLGAEAARTLREQAGAVDIERHALGQLMAQVSAGTLSPRQLAAYPTFLKSAGINDLLTQMSTLETERTRALERRTEKDPEIVAIATSVQNLERQLVPLARAYAGALDQQAQEIARQLGTVETRLSALPGQAESSLQAQRNVKQLSTTFGALQAQIVDARLAAIGEGGQVRRIDEAEPPKKPGFPRPSVTLLAGGVGGLVLGLILAIVRGALDGRVWTPADVERTTLLPAYAVRSGSPMLLGAGARAGTLVVVPIAGAPPELAAGVARAVGADAEQRGRTAALVDARGVRGGASLRADVAAAEAQHGLVVVAGRTLDDAATAALLEPPRAVLLAAAPGTRREAIAAAHDALGRLAVPCLGVAFAHADAVTMPDPARATTAVRRMSGVATTGLPSHVPADGE